MAEERDDGAYGGRGRNWHPDFVFYMDLIVEHPNFSGIPAARDDEGKIDWTVPSNRKPGSKNWDGNSRRREWWRQQAERLGVGQAGHWLRDTARALHPLGEKPCQTCGRYMSISYVYPTKNLQKQLDLAFPQIGIEWDEIPSIFDLIDQAAAELSDESTIVDGFVRALRITGTKPPSTTELREIIQTEYVEKDSRLLSPGAMSNAPDRLDGFHTYNLCCRSGQDRGRSRTNLNKYTVDRRAYEHWSEGNWVLADFMMRQMPIGLCRGPAPCAAKSHPVQLTADHVGPISLGFRHSTHFNGLCQSCNSAKNNRMTLADVASLLNLEAAGEPIASTHAQRLWSACAPAVASDQDALLLSRVMRINQETYLRVLAKVAESNAPYLLLPRLQLDLAQLRVTSMHVDPDTLELTRYSCEERQGTYEAKRVERVSRIAFEALRGRGAERRNIHLVGDTLLDPRLTTLDLALARTTIPAEVQQLNEWIRQVVEIGDPTVPAPPTGDFKRAAHLAGANAADVNSEIAATMGLVQDVLASRFVAGDHRVGFN